MRGENGPGSDIETKTWRMRRMQADEGGGAEEEGPRSQGTACAKSRRGQAGVLTQGMP